MRIIDCLFKLKKIASKNASYSEIGDVYELWNQDNSRFDSIITNIESSLVTSNHIDLNIIIYYGDRLLSDKSNLVEIFDYTTTIINSVINQYLSEEDVELVSDINIEFFKQKFMDELAGGYARLTLRLPNSLGDCTL